MRHLLFLFLLVSGISFAQDPDDYLLKESINETDLPVNEYMSQELSAIRKEFSEITRFKDWESKEEIELNESTEGGFVTIYKDESGTRKMVHREFGEMYQSLREYYLSEGELIFVLEKILQYNRPIYYDEQAMKENNDNQAFDPLLSEFHEYRSYFIDGKLVHQLDNHDCGAPFNQEYLENENKRIWDNFNNLLDAADAHRNSENRTIVGLWQGVPVVGSGWAATYQFYEDGTFKYNHNQMACDDSIYTEYGTYTLDAETLHLNFNKILYLQGGKLQPSTGSCASEMELIGGTEVTERINRSEQHKLKFVAPLLDYEYLERILLDDSEWFRMAHNPDDY